MVLGIEPKAPGKLRTCSVSALDTENFEGGLRLANPRLGDTGPLTREEEPKLPSEAFGDAFQDQLPSFGCSVHAHATPILKEVDVPGFLLHLLLGLREGTWSGELRRVLVPGPWWAGLPPLWARLVACCGNYPWNKATKLRVQSHDYRGGVEDLSCPPQLFSSRGPFPLEAQGP